MVGIDNFFVLPSCLYFDTDGLVSFLKDIMGTGQFKESRICLFDKVIMHADKNAQCSFRAEMSDRAWYKMNVIFRTFVCNFINSRVIVAEDFRAGTELEIILVGIMDKFHRLLMSYIFIDMSADFIVQRKLTIGKGAGTGPSVHDGARVTVDTMSKLSSRAGTLGKISSLIDNQNSSIRFFGREFQGSENTCRASPDDDGIITILFHSNPSNKKNGDYYTI